MKDYLAASNPRINSFRIANIIMHEFNIGKWRKIGSVTRQQAVQNPNRMALGKQRPHQIGADESRSASH